MGRFHASFVVAADPAAAVVYLADYGHTVEWDPGTVRCNREGAGPVSLGSTWTNVSQFRGKEVALTYELVEKTCGRLRFEGFGRGATASDDFTITAEGTGSRIEYAAVITLLGWRAIADPFLRPLYARMGAGAVAGLRAALG